MYFHNQNNSLFELIPGADEFVVSSVFPARTVSIWRSLFEYAIIEAEPKGWLANDNYFSPPTTTTSPHP